MMRIICTLGGMGFLRSLKRDRLQLRGVRPDHPSPRTQEAPGTPSSRAPVVLFEGRLVSVRDAARRLKVHPTTVRRRAARGDFTLHRNLVGLGMTEEDIRTARQQPPARGRPPGTAESEQATVERVLAMREAGVSYAEIARGLNADGVPTARAGRQWWASSVRSLWVAAQGVTR